MRLYGVHHRAPAQLLLGSVRIDRKQVLVRVNGEAYVIIDIGMRMLAPRELFRAQGFHEQYVIDPIFNGKPMTKTSQIKCCGNSVCPPMAAALVRSNFQQSQVVAA